jgi:hypothetical protein
MPQLAEDISAFGVHSICDPFPCLDVLGRVDCWDAEKIPCLVRLSTIRYSSLAGSLIYHETRKRPLTNLQPTRCGSLRIIFHNSGSRIPTWRTTSRQWTHDDTMRELKLSNLEGRE